MTSLQKEARLFQIQKQIIQRGYILWLYKIGASHFCEQGLDGCFIFSAYGVNFCFVGRFRLRPARGRVQGEPRRQNDADRIFHWASGHCHRGQLTQSEGPGREGRSGVEEQSEWILLPEGGPVLSEKRPEGLGRP